jgi:hypothetical protein
MNEQTGVFTAYERESLNRLGKALQAQAKHTGKLHKDNPEVSGLCLAVFKLGVAIERFSALDGHMEIWATFVPNMYAGVAHPPEESEPTD